MKLETLNFIDQLLQSEVGRRRAALSEARKERDARQDDAVRSASRYGLCEPDVASAAAKAQNKVELLERYLEDASLAFDDFHRRDWK